MKEENSSKTQNKKYVKMENYRIQFKKVMKTKEKMKIRKNCHVERSRK